MSPLARCSASMTTRRETEARGHNQAERETFIYQGKGAFPLATQGNHSPSPKHLPASEGFGGSPAPSLPGLQPPHVVGERWGHSWRGGGICHYPRFHPPHREQAGSPLGKAVPPPWGCPTPGCDPPGMGEAHGSPSPHGLPDSPLHVLPAPEGAGRDQAAFFKAEGKYPPWG